MRKIIVILLAVISGVAIFLPFQKVISFTETHVENPQLHYVTLATDKQFFIRYTHSIHKTDVIEKYQVTDDLQMQMLEMIYESLAIGLPGYAEQGQRLERKDGKYHLYFEQKTTLPEFVMHIGDIDMALTLGYNDQEYKLKSNLTRGPAYLCKVQRVSLFQLWKGAKLL